MIEHLPIPKFGILAGLGHPDPTILRRIRIQSPMPSLWLAIIEMRGKKSLR